MFEASGGAGAGQLRHIPVTRLLDGPEPSEAPAATPSPKNVLALKATNSAKPASTKRAPTKHSTK